MILIRIVIWSDQIRNGSLLGVMLRIHLWIRKTDLETFETVVTRARVIAMEVMRSGQILSVWFMLKGQRNQLI